MSPSSDLTSLMLRVIAAQCWIDAQAYGSNIYNEKKYAYVKLNGVAVWQASWKGEFPNRRGANVIIVDPASCTLQVWRNFDTFGSRRDALQLRDFLQRLSNRTVLVIVSCDEASRYLYDVEPTLNALGADVSDVRYRGAWVFVAEKGDPAKTVLDKKLTEAAAQARQPRVNASFEGAYYKV